MSRAQVHAVRAERRRMTIKEIGNASNLLEKQFNAGLITEEQYRIRQEKISHLVTKPIPPETITIPSEIKIMSETEINELYDEDPAAFIKRSQTLYAYEIGKCLRSIEGRNEKDALDHATCLLQMITNLIDHCQQALNGNLDPL